MGKVIDITGEKFGLLMVEKREPNNNRNQAMWRCKCDCGNTIVSCSGNLRSGNTKSCGCVRISKTTKHGMYKTRTYRSWNSMIQRCTNKNSPYYHRYGGRGIGVSKRWMKFERFYADMGDRPEGKSLDRKDNDKGYSKNNCRWATQFTQMNNTRWNHFIEHEGKKLSLRQWDRELGGRPSLVASRLKNGWSEVDAVSKPINKNCSDWQRR